jgi:hypothetical protein
MATIYLNADIGNDTTGDGSSALPYETMAKGFDSIATDDTIYLQESTAQYDSTGENFSGNLTIDGDGADNCEVYFIQNYNKFEIVGNLTIRNISIDRGGTLGVGWGVKVSTGVGVFENLVIKSTSYEFNATYGAVTHTYTGCVVTGYSTAYNNFMSTQVSGSIVNYNNCLFYNDSTVTPPSGSFVRTDYDTGGIVNFKNCIVYRDYVSAFVMCKSTFLAGWNFTNCLWYCPNGVTNPPSTSTDCLENIDPLFVDAPNGNYNLRPTSPCIDAGTLV